MARGPILPKPRCPKCHGALLRDGDELLCIPCAYREPLGGDGPQDEQPVSIGTVTAPSNVQAWLKQGEDLADQMAREGEALLQRGRALLAEAKRLRAMLTPKKHGGGRKAWTPEQRAAQSERLRERNRQRKAAAS